MKNTNKNLYQLITNQGIICGAPIDADADFTCDLGYKPCDLAELARLIQLEFDILIPEQDLDRIKKVSDLSGYLGSVTLNPSNMPVD